jgi:hypothetical protein
LHYISFVTMASAVARGSAEIPSWRWRRLATANFFLSRLSRASRASRLRLNCGGFYENYKQRSSANDAKSHAFSCKPTPIHSVFTTYFSRRNLCPALTLDGSGVFPQLFLSPLDQTASTRGPQIIAQALCHVAIICR